MQAGDEVQAAPPQQAWRRDRLRRAFASALFFFVLLTMTDFDQKGRTPRSAARRVQTNASEVEAATARAERRVEAMQAMIGSCAKPMGRNISGRYFGSWRGSTAAPPPSGSAGWFDDERDGAPRGTPRVDGAVSWQALSSDCRTEAIAAVMRHLHGREGFPARGPYPAPGAPDYSQTPGSLFGSPLQAKLTQSIGEVDVVVEQPTSGDLALDLVELPTAIDGVTRINGFVEMHRKVSIILQRRPRGGGDSGDSGGAASLLRGGGGGGGTSGDAARAHTSVINKTVTVEVPIFGFYFQSSGVMRLLSAASYGDAAVSLPAPPLGAAKASVCAAAAEDDPTRDGGAARGAPLSNRTSTSTLHGALLSAMRASSGGAAAVDGAKVSVLLLTVIFHATHAHNLTRSP
jgi:hypothetical protein